VKKLSLIASGLIIAGTLIGCGEGDTIIVKNEGLKEGNLKASDAYVARGGLDYIIIGDRNITDVYVRDNGEITFFARDFDRRNVEITIPKSAGVDIDGDGFPDQKIRMALKTKGTNTVANPIGTAFLNKVLSAPIL